MKDLLLKNNRLLIIASLVFFLASSLKTGFTVPLWHSIGIKIVISVFFSVVVAVIWEKIGKNVWQQWKDLENDHHDD